MRRYAPKVLSIAALLGMAVSAWLLVQYLLPASQAASCGPGGGCHVVRTCWLGRLGGGSWPLWPLLGVVGFGGMLVLSFASEARWRKLIPLGGYAFMAMGAFLLVSQRLVCHAFCPFCVATDGMGLLVGAAALIGSRETFTAPTWSRWAFGVLGAAAIVGPFLWGFSKGTAEVAGANVADLPAPVAVEQRAGVATIVEFADFECPFCRRQHLELMQVLPSYGPRVRLVRKHVPLHFHEHADGAARAACCAEEQGHGDEMADQLFRNEDIGPTGCEQHAESLHLEMDAFRSCVQAPRTVARIAADHEAATASGVEGLPTMFVGHVKFEGVVSAAVLRQTIEQVLHSGG